MTPLQRFLKWSVSDRRTRTISPLSQVTVSEWLENRIKEGTVEGLRAALQVDPANGRITAHLGRRLADQALKQGIDPDEAQRARGEADFLTSRAVKLAPDNEEVKKLRDKVVKLLRVKANWVSKNNQGRSDQPAITNLNRPSKSAESELTDQGDAATQFDLGVRYLNGAGVPQDLRRAAKLYQKAADQGLAVAQFSLGRLYEIGEGVPKNLGKARELYEKGANQGYEPAITQLKALSRDPK